MLRDFISPTNQGNKESVNIKPSSRNPKIVKPAFTEIVDSSKPIPNPVTGGLESLTVEKINEKVKKLKSNQLQRVADEPSMQEETKSADNKSTIS